MTDEQIRDMYLSLGYGDNWEQKPIALFESTAWTPFRLGMPINNQYEYRKCWYVVKGCSSKVIANRTDNGHYLYKGESEEDCKKWLKENEKTWVERQVDFLEETHCPVRQVTEAAFNAVADEILERVGKYMHFASNNDEDLETFIYTSDLKSVIKEMGIGA